MFTSKNSSQKENKNLLKKVNDFLLHYFYWLVLLLILLVLILSFSFFLYPEYKKINKEIKEYEEEHKNLFSAKQKKLNNLNDYIESYRKISSSEKEKIVSMLPNKYNREELFSELNHLVDKNNLMLKEISVNKKATSSQEEKKDPLLNLGVQEYSINMSVAGVNYYSLRNFLDTLENNIRILDVNGIDFAPKSRIVKLELSTYYLK